MRNAFIEELVALAAVNPQVALVVGDLGYSVVEPFAERFPERFINAGVAEQNMTGLAAGMASEGYHVFTYSIANFPVFRCAEQIRNDVDYHRLPVTIVAVGGGLAYGALGYSHHAVQDYALLRSFPNMAIAAPGDPSEVRACLRWLIENPQPSYLRLGKAGEPTFHAEIPDLRYGHWLKVSAGETDDGEALLTTGATLGIAMDRQRSRPYRNRPTVYSMPLWGMSAKAAQPEQVARHLRVTTLEDHLRDGGFGSWLMESVADDTDLLARLKTNGLDPRVLWHGRLASHVECVGWVDPFDFRSYSLRLNVTDIPTQSLSAAAPKRSRLLRLSAAAGLDFHVVVTLMFRGWTIVAGAATMLLLPLWLNPIEQGYYYTFASVLALQVFFELGLNQIVVQLVSHEVAHLEVGRDGVFTGRSEHLDKLASLAQLMRRWYAIAAVLFWFCGGLAGALFFSRKGTLPTTAWVGAWLLLTVGAAINLFLSPSLAMMEGTGQVGQVARLRLLQSFVGSICLWGALFAGAGLWAVCAPPLVAAAFTGFWLRERGTGLRGIAGRFVEPSRRIRWRHDIFPFQWRIALSWVSGYFIFSIFTPLIFSHQGAVEAGRLGMALTVFNAVSAIGMSWINAKVPSFTMLISRAERSTLNSLFLSVMWRSCVATLLLSVFVILVASALINAGVPVMARLASLPVLACLGWVTVVNSVIFAVATYMRAHREEPLLPISVVTALLTSIAAWYGSRTGAFSVMMFYALVTTFVALPWSLMLFRRYFKRAA